MSEDKSTTIRIYESTKRKLLERGRMGESYDDLLLRLLDELNEKGGS